MGPCGSMTEDGEQGTHNGGGGHDKTIPRPTGTTGTGDGVNGGEHWRTQELVAGSEVCSSIAGSGGSGGSGGSYGHT